MKRSHQNRIRTFCTLSMCSVLVVCLCGGFLFTLRSSAAEAVGYAEGDPVSSSMLDSSSQYVGDSQNLSDFSIQFRAPNDRVLYFPYDSNSFSFKITYDSIYQQLGYKNGDLSYGTSESSNSNRWALYYPFSGEYVFPAPFGPVSHYEMDFTFRVKTCMSAHDFSRMYPDRYGDIYRYQPYSLVDFAVFGYVTKDGQYREVDTNVDWLDIVFYNCENVTDGISVTPTSINYWNQLHTTDTINCHLRLRINQLPSDFGYFISSYIFFGRSFYYLYASDMPGSFTYLEIEPLTSWLTTFWYTDEYYVGIDRDQDVYENWFKPTPGVSDEADDQLGGASDFMDTVDRDHADWQDSIDSILASYGYVPEVKADEWSLLISDYLGITNRTFITSIWNFYKDYSYLSIFLSLAGIFIMITFLLRR